MTATNIIIHDNLPFSVYQALPGNSFSSIRHDKPFEPSPKMRLGTAVHQYLMEPQSFVGNLQVVKPLAMALRDVLGSLWHYLKFEISVTAHFEHEDFKMPWKGRIDAGIRRKVVIDFKVGDDIRKSMKFFQYPDQLTGYACGFEAPVAFIIAISPKGGKPEIIPVEINTQWWEEQVLMKGTYDDSREELIKECNLLRYRCDVLKVNLDHNPDATQSMQDDLETSLKLLFAKEAQLLSPCP